MKYSEFISLLEGSLLSGTLPKMSQWPVTIELSKEFRELMQKIFDSTSLTGNEHEVSIFYIDGDILASSMLKGEKNKVEVNHNVNLAYIPQNNGKYEKQIYIDHKVVKKYKVDKVPSKQVIKYLMNVHSHPKFKDLSGKDNYSFFSVTDIENFINSTLPVVGLVTDRLWLACKTEKTIKKVGTVGEEMVYFVTEGAYKGSDNIEELVLKEMKNWGIVFYCADFKEKLTRIN